MKTNKDRIFEYIVEKSQEFRSVNDEIPKFETRFLSDELNMQRTNISSALNQLVEEGKLGKTNGRPVMFYLSEEQRLNIETMFFNDLIGYSSSLSEVLNRTEAAVAYPNKIARVLFTGGKGVGVRTISQRVYRYACAKRIIRKDAKFLTVNCLHFDEEELRKKFTGKDNIFENDENGVVLIRHAEVVAKSLLSDTVQLFRTKELHSFILLVHCDEGSENISYLKEYCNFVLRVPPLEERGLQERFQFVEKFFADEARKLDKKIEVNYGILQCLLMYPCRDNLIELRNDIQYGVANANIRTKRNQNIVIGISDFNSSVRKGLLYIRGNSKEIEKVLKKNMNYIFTGEETYRYLNQKDSGDIYHQMDFDVRSLGKDVPVQDENDFLFANIETNLLDYLNRISEGMNEEKVKSLVSIKMIEMVNAFLDVAATRFAKTYSNRIYYALCLHMNNAIINSSDRQRISNDKVMQMIETNGEEYILSRRFIRKIEETFHVRLSLDESIFATLVLTIDEAAYERKSEVVTLIVMHGKNTATSIAEVVRKLMPIRNLEAFDLSLDVDVEVSYEQLKQKIKAIDRGKGILVFYDMGSIQMMVHSISEETGIEIRTIDFPIPLFAMSAQQKSDEGASLEEIHHFLSERFFNVNYQRMNNKEVVIALSSVKENSAESIKRYLETSEDAGNYQILAFNINDKQNLIQRINAIQLRGTVIGIVGTYNPEIFNIPYRDYLSISNAHTIHNLFAEKNDDFDVLQYLKEQFPSFKEEALRNTLVPLMEELEHLFHTGFSEDMRLGLLIHMGCLIDRMTKKLGSGINFNINEIKEKYPYEFNAIKKILETTEETFDIRFNDSDIAIIIEIITQPKKEKKI